MIKFCKSCLNPSTRPNIKFDKDGKCYVCVYESLKKTDFKYKKNEWKKRSKEIKKIKIWAKKNKKNSEYDCIIPVSAGKDSYRQAFYVRDILKMNPLLVCNSYPPEQLTNLGAANMDNLVKKGFDVVTISLDPLLWKKLYQYCLKFHGNMMKASEMALYAAPVHIALSYGIPLMFYGENPAHTIGEKHGKLTGDAIGIRKGNTIKGGPLNLGFNFKKKSDYYFYNYPALKNILKNNLRIIYLGYYIKDWYGYKNAKFALKKGFNKRSDLAKNTGDLWGFTGVDDDIRLVNQYLKYLKYGFGHVTDQVIEAIHQGFMSRKEAINVVKKFDGACHQKYINKFCKYAEISKKEFEKITDKIVNKKLFFKSKDKWKPKFSIK